MSAATLDDSFRVITISDENESFFHLLLFFAIRFLPSNCRDVSKFMYDYFDGYKKHEDVYKCGSDKLAAMEKGVIVISDSHSKYILHFFRPVLPTDTIPVPPAAAEVPPMDEGGVLYGPHEIHPIDYIFKELLKFFSAHYKLEETTVETTVHDDPSPPSTPGNAMSEPEDPLTEELDWFDSLAVETSAAPVFAPANASASITAEEEARLKVLAQNVQTHKGFIQQLGSRWRRHKDWPANDKVPDRHRKDFQPGRAPQPAAPPASAPGSTLGSKRQSMHDEADVEHPPSKRRSARLQQ